MPLNIILWILFGAAAGWAAGKIMNSSPGWVMNIILGIVGSVVGGFLASLVGISTTGFSIGALIIAIAGACLLIWLVRKLK